MPTDGTEQHRPDGVRLPAELAHRLTAVRRLDRGAAEAELVLAREAGGEQVVVKHYLPGNAADRAVWRRLDHLRHPAVIPVLDRGTTTAGRDFEVFPYFPHGSLQRFWDGSPLRTALLRTFVSRLTGGINCLHAARIVHRDLKPDNLLVRTGVRDVVIADFGISRAADVTRARATTSMTLAYAPPEALDGRYGEPSDWWSLGMIVRQLATGATPYAGQDSAQVVAALRHRDQDVSHVPAELRELCAGLLQRDPERRWRGPEVLAWLNGERPAPRPGLATTRVVPGGSKPPSAPAPAVAPEVAEARRGAAAHVVRGGPAGTAGPLRALPFAGRRFTDRAGLARAVREHQTQAGRTFFARMGTPESPGDGWSTLRQWIRQFDDPDVDDVEGRIRLIDQQLTVDHTPDVKVIYLLRWLDPTTPPALRGRTVTAEALIGECLGVANGKKWESSELLADVSRPGVLDALAEFPDLRELRGVAQRRQVLARAWETGFASAADGWEGAGGKGGPAPEIRHLVLLAALGQPAERALTRLRRRVVPPEADQYPPYRGALAAARRAAPGISDLVQLVHGPAAAAAAGTRARAAAQKQAQEQAAVRAREKAQAEKQAQDAARKARKARRSALVKEWRAEEEQRLSFRSRTAALARAAGWVACWAGPGVLLALLAVPRLFDNPHLGWHLATGIGWASGLCLLLRAGTIWKLGGAYRPPFLSAERWRAEEAGGNGWSWLWTVPGLALVALGSLAYREPGPLDDFFADFGWRILWLLAMAGALLCFVAAAWSTRLWDSEHRARAAAHKDALNRLSEPPAARRSNTGRRR
ncbi:protein kinase [Kitasatospora hibisci]|uniref:protein kinase domain-containing protein n=1 Tax=Kitasatospora hibisci TaxID=3369522 RepID=UPI0037545011